MNVSFYKYQGTGNDFVIIDNRTRLLDKLLSTKLIEKICNRRFGIGADGLILLQNKAGYDFEMIYYNADGNQSSMCGNGGRCVVSFAKKINLIKEHATFLAIDGIHKASINRAIVSLKMNDVNAIEINSDYYFLDTGSPHYVAFTNDLKNYNVFNEGKKIRNNSRFGAAGVNVNFIEQIGNDLHVRTYERGVEAETFSCGTGAVAAALVNATATKDNGINFYTIKTLGGDLNVKFDKLLNDSFSNIWLEGPADFVFKGDIDIDEYNRI